MSLHFPRSLDSLQANSARPIYATLGLAFVLLLLWSYWFLAGTLARYEHGQILQTTPDGLIIAEFPAQAFDRLQLDQPAWLHPQSAGDKQIKSIAATVLTLPAEPPMPDTSGRIQVELYSDLDDQNEEIFANGFTGEVRVEIAYLSPWALLTEQIY